MVVKFKKQFFAFLLFFVFFPFSSVHAEHSGYPVVIVPGMLASFDKKLMMQDVEDNKWGFIWGGNVYKALIKEFEDKNGYYQYEEGKSLFIAYYDWRKPVSETYKKYLKPKIDEAKQKSGKDKVDIVAHSMGGLLARAYIQSDDYQNDVNKVVMMGTPNRGSSDAYIVWEGGQYPTSWNPVYKGALNYLQKSLKKTRNLPNITPPLSFREFFPSLRDLLPTTDFVKRGGSTLTLSSMADRNNFLINLNNNITAIKDRVAEAKTYSGITGKTMATINIGSVCTVEDNTNKRWRDGHPSPDPPTADSDQGDETVLLTSASINGIENYTFDSTSHTKLPDKARYDIPSFLNPPMLAFFRWPTNFSSFFIQTAQADDEDDESDESDDDSSDSDDVVDSDAYVEPDSMLSFTVSANTTFELTDPDGKILSKDKNELGEDNAYFDDDPSDPDDVILVTIRNPKAGKYTLKLTGTTAGDYYVDSTYVNDNGVFEDSSDGTIKQGEEKTLEATVSAAEGVDLPSNKEETSDTVETTSDTKNESSSGGANTSSDNNQRGSVLGAATVRIKLSQTILGVKLRIEREIVSAALQPRKDALLLMAPLNEMLLRAKMYEAALAAKKTKLAASLLQKTKEDYQDFANKVDRLIAKGKLNQQTVNVLIALKQRLEKAGLR